MGAWPFTSMGAGVTPQCTVISFYRCFLLDKGTRVKQTSHQHQDDRKGLEAAHMYDDVFEFPVYATVNKPKNVKRDDSVHYADIQVFTRARERSAEEVKNLQMQNATEYATLNFPHPRLKYDSRNGTLV
nr:uncharacterized protein C11orf52 homolog isoform X2 [Pelodiscus sinensis]|eukprot:XP_025039487.1 uncharacterized protein C11orf52 homolog isoform X2 [Pelodiscus sinensis]